MSEQTMMTGPAELRRIADALDEQSVVFSSAGWIVITNTSDVRQQAAAWEADISARDHAVDLAGVNAEAANELERRAERAEAALERAQTQVALYEGRHPAQLGPDGREVAPRHRFNSDGICVRCGGDAESDTGCVEELRAALERARALAVELAAMRYKDDVTRDDYREYADKLAALLAAASGGAA